MFRVASFLHPAHCVVLIALQINQQSSIIILQGDLGARQMFNMAREKASSKAVAAAPKPVAKAKGKSKAKVQFRLASAVARLGSAARAEAARRFNRRNGNEAATRVIRRRLVPRYGLESNTAARDKDDDSIEDRLQMRGREHRHDKKYVSPHMMAQLKQRFR